MELNTCFDFSSNIGLGFKYQFIGDHYSNFNASIGADAGINIFTIFYEVPLYMYSVSLYLSHSFNERFTFYGCPRFINNSLLRFDNSNPDEYQLNNSRFWLSYGILIGKKNKFSLEISHHSSYHFARPIYLTFGCVLTIRGINP